MKMWWYNWLFSSKINKRCKKRKTKDPTIGDESLKVERSLTGSELREFEHSPSEILSCDFCQILSNHHRDQFPRDLNFDFGTVFIGCYW